MDARRRLRPGRCQSHTRRPRDPWRPFCGKREDGSVTMALIALGPRFSPEMVETSVAPSLVDGILADMWAGRSGEG